MTAIVQAGAAAVLALGAGAATLSMMRQDLPPVVIPEGAWVAGGALDGQVFETVDTVLETGEVLVDTLHFADGRFQSAKCQDYCDFGWSEYRTWSEGDAVHFSATTACPDAPHSVVWHGTVRGDQIRHDATWTTRRWYWTRRIGTTGQGVALSPGQGADNG